MKISTLNRHIREGFRNLSRNGWMTFASASAVTVTLLLLGVFLVLAYNVQSFSNQIEAQVEMNVMIKDGTNQADMNKLGEELKSLPGVGSVQFVSKADGLKELRTELKQNGDLLNGLDQNNPLPDKYIVKAADPRNTGALADKIQKFPLVDKVNYGQDTVDKLFTFTKIIRNTGAVFVVALCFTALFLINNTIKITIFARRREIEIMKLVGATNNFIRWPFLVEGLLIGVIGALLPIIAISIGYNYLVNNIHTVLLFDFAPTNPLIGMVILVLIVIGALIGMIGSTMSIRRFLKV